MGLKKYLKRIWKRAKRMMEESAKLPWHYGVEGGKILTKVACRVCFRFNRLWGLKVRIKCTLLNITFWYISYIYIYIFVLYCISNQTPCTCRYLLFPTTAKYEELCENAASRTSKSFP